jgi:1-acyl-sn-glycerol-3-phosphate acyltransferase
VKPLPPPELEGPSLGSDPFSGGDGTLPFLIRMRERSLRAAPDVDVPPPPQARRAAAGGQPDLGPPLPDVTGFEDPDDLSGWVDRAAGLLLDRDDEERFSSLSVALGSRPYDALGLSTRTARRALAVFKLLYRFYFRVESSGHEHLPEKGGAILAGNHGGLLPFDAAMTIVDVILRAHPPRLPRAIVERWAGTLPFVNVFYARVGQVIGTKDNFERLLRDGQLVLVFPEGVAGIRKRAAERYVLQRFHVGFIEESLRHRAPIVPVAIVGADDQAPILYDIRPLAKMLGLPVFPITPTFPLLGPLGLLPYPVRYQIRYGEPLRFYEEYPAEAIGDPHAVRYMAERVRHRIQEMVDRDVLERRGRAR